MPTTRKTPAAILSGPGNAVLQLGLQKSLGSYAPLIQSSATLGDLETALEADRASPVVVHAEPTDATRLLAIADTIRMRQDSALFVLGGQDCSELVWALVTLGALGHAATVTDMPALARAIVRYLVHRGVVPQVSFADDLRLTLPWG